MDTMISTEHLADENTHQKIEAQFSEFMGQLRRDILSVEYAIDLLHDEADRSDDPIVLLVDASLDTTTRVLVDRVNTVESTVTFVVEHPLDNTEDTKDTKDDKFVINIDALVEGTPENAKAVDCLLYTSPSPRDKRQSRMPSSA